MVSLLILVIIAALVFDYINGFHDTANAIATSVATGVLSIRAAVILAGIFNFVGAIVGTGVAKFIASGLADPNVVSQAVVLAALLGASAWNLITWWYGIPSSSSHALIGGLAGAVVAHAGLGAFKWAALGEKVLLPLVISPLLGFVIALFTMIVILWLVRHRRPTVVNRGARQLQLLSACTLAFSHGSNDAQKAMGVITLALLAFMAAHAHPGDLPEWMQANQGWLLPGHHLDAHGKSVDDVPLWVVISCGLAMALGTMAGGKRIIKTMGSKLIRITPLQGFAAQASGTVTILLASVLGRPVSTTHCISAAILGAGASKRISAVRWGVAANIVVAWVLTIPLSAAMAFAIMWLIGAIFGG